MSDSFYTADLCDAHEAEVRTTDPVFSIYGKRLTFGGPIRTLRVFEDNSLVKDAVSGKGDGSVLVVDGGAFATCTRSMPATSVFARWQLVPEKAKSAAPGSAMWNCNLPVLIFAQVSTSIVIWTA